MREFEVDGFHPKELFECKGMPRNWERNIPLEIFYIIRPLRLSRYATCGLPLYTHKRHHNLIGLIVSGVSDKPHFN